MSTEKEPQISALISQPTEKKEPKLEEIQPEVKAEDFHAAPPIEEFEEEEEDPSPSDNYEEAPQDFDNTAAFIVMGLDILSSFGFTHGLEKKMLRNLTKEQRSLFVKFQIQPPTNPEEDQTADEKAAISALQQFNEIAETIPLQEKETEQLVEKVTPILAKHNVKVTPEMALIGSVAMIFGSRVKHIL